MQLVNYMMAISEGESRLVETVFENRFMHVAELVRMGANIETYGKEAVVLSAKPVEE